MIDWPNLIVGFAIGLVPTIALWMIDRRRARRQRVLDASTAWMSAAKEIELAAGQPDATAGSLYLARVKYPVDLWRSILGSDDFRAEERLEGAFAGVEHFERRFAQGQNQPGDEDRLERARQERHNAFVAFANISRAMQSVSYDDVVTAEQ